MSLSLTELSMTLCENSNCFRFGIIWHYTRIQFWPVFFWQRCRKLHSYTTSMEVLHCWGICLSS